MSVLGGGLGVCGWEGYFYVYECASVHGRNLGGCLGACRDESQGVCMCGGVISVGKNFDKVTQIVSSFHWRSYSNGGY